MQISESGVTTSFAAVPFSDMHRYQGYRLECSKVGGHAPTVCDSGGAAWDSAEVEMFVADGLEVVADSLPEASSTVGDGLEASIYGGGRGCGDGDDEQRWAASAKNLDSMVEGRQRSGRRELKDSRNGGKSLSFTCLWSPAVPAQCGVGHG